MEFEKWGMSQEDPKCRQWCQDIYNHNLNGVKIKLDFNMPSLVDPIHFFACGNVARGGIKNSRAVLDFLLENNCNINSKDKQGWVPLNYSIWFGHFFTTDLLLESGALIQNEYAQPLDTALSTITYNSDAAMSCARLLLLSGADPNLSKTSDNLYGSISWLTWALEHENFELAKLLHSKGATIKREREIKLLLLRGNNQVLSWAEYHNLGISSIIDPSHNAYSDVMEAFALRLKETILKNLEEEVADKEEDEDNGSGRKKRKI